MLRKPTCRAAVKDVSLCTPEKLLSLTIASTAARLRQPGKGLEAMRDIDLFQLALGLVPPWMVADAKFDTDKKRLAIEIDFKTGGCFPCPDRSKADCPVHDTLKKTLALPQFFPAPGLPACARAPHRLPQVRLRLVTVPSARPGSGFTAFVRGVRHDPRQGHAGRRCCPPRR